MILSTHIVSDLEAVASTIAVMRQGRLLALVTPEELLQRATGCVFTTVVPSAQLAEVQKTVHVSGLVRKADGVHLRYVAAGASLSGSVAVEPSLEDAYLVATLQADARTAA